MQDYFQAALSYINGPDVDYAVLNKPQDSLHKILFVTLN